MIQVLLFRAWTVGSPIGVDAFILISAYLMTSSFVRRSESGRMPFFIERWANTFKRLIASCSHRLDDTELLAEVGPVREAAVSATRFGSTLTNPTASRSELSRNVEVSGLSRPASRTPWNLGHENEAALCAFDGKRETREPVAQVQHPRARE